MNAVPTPPAAPASRAPVPPLDPPARLREIPYNYTSFSDREIVIRLLGDRRLAAARRAARRASHGPLGAHALRGARRHLGRAAQPVPRAGPARQPAAARPADRGAAPPPRRDRPAPRRAATRERDAKVGRAARRGAARGDRVRAVVRRRPMRCGAARAATLGRAHARRQRLLRRLRARLARDRRHRLARRDPVRRAHARRRGRDARAGARLHRARPDDHPARRRHRLHRQRRAADADRGGDQHREARAHRRRRAASRCRASTGTVPTLFTEAGVVTRRVEEAAHAAGFVFAVDPTSADASVRRRQHRHERRRQEGRAVGHGARQPRLVAHGRPARQLARGDARRAQPRQDPRRAERGVRARLEGRPQRARQRARAAHRAARDRGPALPQGGPRQGRHRQVPRRPARRAEGRLRRHHHRRRAGSCTGCRRTSARCASSSSARRATRSRRSSRSATTSRAPGATRGVRLAGLEHLDERYLRAVGYATQVQARRAAEDGAARRHRRRRRGGGRAVRLRGRAHRQRPRRRGLHRRQRRGAQGLLARPRAHRRDRPPHQRVQDQRGRGDPARAPRRVHRRDRAHQHRVLDRATSCALLDALEAYLAGAPRVGKTGDADIDRLPRGGSARRPAAAGARGRSPPRGAAGRGCSATWTARSRRRSARLRRARPRRRCARELERRIAADPALRVFDLLQDRTIRVSWKAEVRGELRAPLRRRPVRAAARRPRARSTQRVLRSRVFVALHMHAGDGNVHTNIPVNSDDYAMLQEANRAVGAHHAHRARARRRDLRRARHRHHQARVPRRTPRLAEFRAYKAAHRPGRPLQQGQAAARRGPAQRLHAELQPARPRVADHAAVRHQRRSRTRSRTACAAASASRSARRTCRAPTCSTRRATRSSPPRC